MKRIHRGNRGSSAMMIVIITVLVGLGAVFLFQKRANISLLMTKTRVDSLTTEIQTEEAIEMARAKLTRAVDNIRLIGRLPYLSADLDDEEYASLVSVYGQSSETAMNFLRHAVVAQSLDENGQITQGHEFAYFDSGCSELTDCAFPSEWVDPDPSDDRYFEYKFVIGAKEPIAESVPVEQLIFDYQVTIYARAYGSENFTMKTATENGFFRLNLTMAPFSQFALFRSQSVNQDGLIVVFAGGDSTNEIQEFFRGPVHMNSVPYFYGAPYFSSDFSSTESVADWWQGSGTDYTGPALFDGTKMGNVSSVNLPSEMGNALRLAAGDTSSTAATNTEEPTTANVEAWMQNHALGTLPMSGTIPDGIYVPINSGTGLPKGGVYVQGDARISLNVVQGSSDFDPSYWTNIQASHQSCKFQKIAVSHLDPTVTPRDLYIGSGTGCNVTYIFDSVTKSDAPVVLNSRVNGNVFVEGNIDEIGGESRTRPAVAQDFGFNFTARKELRIVNDLQYEDVEYFEQAGDGSISEDPVANAYGELNSSGALPTDGALVPGIDENSYTVLGLVSLERSVSIHLNAPNNLNVNAAIFAGESSAYDAVTDYGCGTAGSGYEGCGFGYEGWDFATGKGTFKLLGSISEYRSQTLGKLSSPPTGFSRRMAYDERFLQDLQPPAFPTSTKLQSYPMFSNFRSFKTSQN